MNGTWPVNLPTGTQDWCLNYLKIFTQSTNEDCATNVRHIWVIWRVALGISQVLFIFTLQINFLEKMYACISESCKWSMESIEQHVSDHLLSTWQLMLCMQGLPHLSPEVQGWQASFVCQAPLQGGDHPHYAPPVSPAIDAYAIISKYEMSIPEKDACSMSIFPDTVHCISLWTLTHSVIKLVF